MSAKGSDPKRDHWLDDPRTVERAVRLTYLVCGLSLAAGLVFLFATHAYDHAHFGFERWPGFPALYGFLAFVIVVYGGIALRKLVSRPDEDYYGDRAPVDPPTEDGLGDGDGGGGD
ncbi:MAG: hypothetical protein AAGD06_19080 [Acidobacteriota bacterium]